MATSTRYVRTIIVVGWRSDRRPPDSVTLWMVTVPASAVANIWSAMAFLNNRWTSADRAVSRLMPEMTWTTCTRATATAPGTLPAVYVGAHVMVRVSGVGGAVGARVGAIDGEEEVAWPAQLYCL